MKRLKDILSLTEMAGKNAIRANDPFFKIEKNITIDNIYGGKNYVQLLHHDKKGAPPVVTEHGHHIYYSHELVPFEKNVGIFKIALVDPKTKSVDFHVQGSTILHPRMGRSLPEFTLEDLSLRSKDKDDRSIQGSNSHPLYRTIMKFGGILKHDSMSDGARIAYKRFKARYRKNMIDWDHDKETGELLEPHPKRFEDPRYDRVRMWDEKKRFSTKMKKAFLNILHRGTV